MLSMMERRPRAPVFREDRLVRDAERSASSVK